MVDRLTEDELEFVRMAVECQVGVHLESLLGDRTFRQEMRERAPIFTGPALIQGLLAKLGSGVELDEAQWGLALKRLAHDALPKYRQEFPDFDDDPVLPPGFEDVSWHNDTCPSWWSKSRRVIAFVDYKNITKRKNETPQFSFCMTNEHAEFVENGVPRVCTDDREEWLAAMLVCPEYTEEQRARIDKLHAGIRNSRTHMAVVDCVDRVDTNADGQLVRIAPDDLRMRFDVRSAAHVQVYKLKVVCWNDAAKE